MRHTGLGIEQHLELLLALDKTFIFEKEFTIGVILMVGSRIRFLPYEFSAQEIEKYTLIQMLMYAIFF